MAQQDQATPDQLGTIRSIMKGVRTAMLTTVDSEGALHSHPMTTQEAQFDGECWFIASSESDTVKQLTANPRVNLAYASSSEWLSVAGTAKVVRDEAKKKELWNTFTEAWFPDGADDPTVVVVKVAGDSAQYWDSPGRLAMTMSMIKARVSGDAPKAGDSDTVEF